jgi:hypothetical protein
MPKSKSRILLWFQSSRFISRSESNVVDRIHQTQCPRKTGDDA